jgi:competence protein ComEA
MSQTPSQNPHEEMDFTATNDYWAFFYHNNQQRLGIHTLIVLSILLFLTPIWWGYSHIAQKIDMSQQQAEIQAFAEGLEAAKKQTYAQKYPQNPPPNYQKTMYANGDSNPEPKILKNAAETFDFEPNTASKSDFVKLGLSEKTAQSILNFREKGGKFRIRADFGKIYTLSASDYERLYPHIQLPEQFETNKNAFTNPKNQQAGAKSKLVLDINTAQAEDFEKLPLIGASFANRFVKYRENLGGYIKVEQIAEVYGLADSVYQLILPQLICPNPQPKQIPLNTVSEAEFRHPYLSFSQAKSILKYRTEQGGKFKNVEFLQSLPALNDGKNTFVKIRPYLKLE